MWLYISPGTGFSLDVKPTNEIYPVLINERTGFKVPRVLIQKLILCFSSSNNYLTPHQFIQLLNVFHPG